MRRGQQYLAQIRGAVWANRSVAGFDTSVFDPFSVGRSGWDEPKFRSRPTTLKSNSSASAAAIVLKLWLGPVASFPGQNTPTSRGRPAWRI